MISRGGNPKTAAQILQRFKPSPLRDLEAGKKRGKTAMNGGLSS